MAGDADSPEGVGGGLPPEVTLESGLWRVELGGCAAFGVRQSSGEMDIRAWSRLAAPTDSYPDLFARNVSGGRT